MLTTSIRDCSASLRKENFYVPENELQECIDQKFENSSNKFESESKFLSYMKESTNLFGNYDIVPTMIIDGNIVRVSSFLSNKKQGKLTGHTAISAICDSYKNKPHICTKVHELLQREITDNYETELPFEIRSRWLIYFCLVLLSLLILATCLYLGKSFMYDNLRDQIENEIKGSIEDYRKITDVSLEKDGDNALKPGNF